jgi:hypothetical protein
MVGVNDTVCQFTAIVNKTDCQSDYRSTGVNAIDTGINNIIDVRFPSSYVEPF